MRVLFSACAVGFALAFIAAPLASADPSFAAAGHAKLGYDQQYRHDDGDRQRPTKAKPRRFSAQDVAIMLSYFSGQPMPWSTLPPGSAKTYARGKRLPLEIAQKHLPLSLEADLPDYPGTRYYLVGNDVVLVDTTTRIVIDVLKNVFG